MPVPFVAICPAVKPEGTASSTVNVPLEAVNVTVISLVPASTSVTESPVTEIAASSSTVMSATDTIGASLTGLIVRLTVWVEVSVPSLVDTEKLSLPVKFVFGV